MPRHVSRRFHPSHASYDACRPQGRVAAERRAAATKQQNHRRGTGQHALTWLGRPVPRASSTPTPSRKRVSLGKGARLGSGPDQARITLIEASRRRARSPHHGGMTSAFATGAATTDLVLASKLALPQGCLQQHQGTWSCLVRERTLVLLGRLTRTTDTAPGPARLKRAFTFPIHELNPTHET